MQQQEKEYLCVNCGTASPNPRLCPECGLPRQGVAQGTLTSLPWLDVLLGVLASFGLSMTGIGAVGAIVLFFTMRRDKPHFTSGIGIGCTIVILLLLGLLALCVGSGIGR